jgi:hypothetical protein
VVVRVPTWDWLTVAPPFPMPYAAAPPPEVARPAVTRLPSRKVEVPPPNLVSEWDVTEPFDWQYSPSHALVGPAATHGFLLAGGLALDQLEAEDNTSCMSLLPPESIRLLVTYTVPPSGGEFVPPR